MKNLSAVRRFMDAGGERADALAGRKVFLSLATFVRAFPRYKEDMSGGYNRPYYKCGLKVHQNSPVHIGWGIYTGVEGGHRYFVGRTSS